MPRDATDTREKLLLAAEELFARCGVHQATTRAITAAAGQRNSSALTYHFGSRSGALIEILRRHGEPLEHQRRSLAGTPLEHQHTRALVAALVLPYTGLLATTSGRNYLRIVDQLTDRFPLWRSSADGLSPPVMRSILTELESRSGAEGAVGRARVVASIMLLTTSVADRARVIDEAEAPDLDHDRFVSNLVDMLVGCLEAPVGPGLDAPT